MGINDCAQSFLVENNICNLTVFLATHLIVLIDGDEIEITACGLIDLQHQNMAFPRYNKRFVDVPYSKESPITIHKSRETPRLTREVKKEIKDKNLRSPHHRQVKKSQKENNGPTGDFNNPHSLRFSFFLPLGTAYDIREKRKHFSQNRYQASNVHQVAINRKLFPSN